MLYMLQLVLAEFFIVSVEVWSRVLEGRICNNLSFLKGWNGKDKFALELIDTLTVNSLQIGLGILFFVWQ